MSNFTEAQKVYENAENPAYTEAERREQLIDWLVEHDGVREAAQDDAVLRIMEGESISGVYVADAVASRVALSESPLREAIEGIAAGSGHDALSLAAVIRKAVEFDVEKELDDIAAIYVIEHIDGHRDSDAVRSALES